MRGVSTVVDVTVFLLLVGGAVATLVAGTSAIPPDGDNPAAENARLLATTTATVDYSLAPAARSPTDGVTFRRTNGSDFERTAHGTLASLLADAAVGSAGLHGTEFSRASTDFRRALRATVRERIGRSDVETSVVAIWRPYPDASVGGRFRVGDAPPRDADVHAATVRVDSGMSTSGGAVRQAAKRDGYRGVARVLAADVVEGLFPPRRTRLALRGDYPVDALTVQRYRRTATVLDARNPGVGEAGVDGANERLAEEFERLLATDLGTRYDSPGDAAAAVETGTVRIVVRTWSP